MLVWADPSACALAKLSVMVSVRSKQTLQLCAALITGCTALKSLCFVFGHECATVLCVGLIAGKVQVPGCLHLYDVVVVNLAVQMLNCLFSYTAIALAVAVAALLHYSLALQQTEKLEPPRPPAIRRKYCKHKH